MAERTGTENSRLRRAVSDLTLDELILEEPQSETSKRLPCRRACVYRVTAAELGTPRGGHAMPSIEAVSIDAAKGSDDTG